MTDDEMERFMHVAPTVLGSALRLADALATGKALKFYFESLRELGESEAARLMVDRSFEAGQLRGEVAMLREQVRLLCEKYERANATLERASPDPTPYVAEGESKLRPLYHSPRRRRSGRLWRSEDEPKYHPSTRAILL